jgi:hypothetical protein
MKETRKESALDGLFFWKIINIYVEQYGAMCYNGYKVRAAKQRELLPLVSGQLITHISKLIVYSRRILSGKV